jgi:hypothetical protein|uniref:Uncharacterized protein n=1 Tax=candidate division WOR-3 bacterium TaxID=2052148 RepID=A0A7V3VU74_UNCW3
MKEIIDSFKALIKSSSRINKILNNYIKLKEKPVENLYLLEKSLNELSKLASGLPDFALKNHLSEWLNNEKSELEKARQEFRFRLGEQIKDLFQKDNKIIRGQYPTLHLGFYTIELNFEFGEVTLYFGPKIEKISKIPLEPESIYKTITKFDMELKKKDFNPKEFFLDLQKAYKNRLAILNKSYGEKVLLVDVLNEYVIIKQPERFLTDPKRENFVGYSRIELAYLLYLFKKSGYSQRGVHLYIATFDATTDRRQSIWIPENEEGEGTYYSYIAFEKASEG